VCSLQVKITALRLHDFEYNLEKCSKGHDVSFTKLIQTKVRVNTDLYKFFFPLSPFPHHNLYETIISRTTPF